MEAKCIDVFPPSMQMPPRQAVIQEFWYRGNISYLLHSGQKILNTKLDLCPTQLFVGNISRQWGKSFWAITKAVSLAIKKPKARIKYGTAFQTDLIEFIMPTFEIVLADCPQGIKPKYKIAGSKWVFPNGSEIKLVGLDKSPNGLRGNTIDLIIIDEAGFVSNLDYIYKSVIVPATLHRPNCKIIFISTPPSTPAHTFVDYVHKAEVEGGYVKLDIYSNPRIGPADIDRMAKECGGYTSTTFRRECLCEFVTDDDSKIIPEWQDGFIVSNEPNEYRRFYHNYVSMDLGVKDFTLPLFAHYDFKRATLVVEDELKLNGPTLTTLSLKEAIIAKEKELWAQPGAPADAAPPKVYRRISDNNNPQLINDMAILHGMAFISTDKDKLETMINETRMMIAKGQVEVHPRCKQLIGCLKYGVWDKKKVKFARSTEYGHFDALAALIYLCRNLDKHSNPIPATYGFDPRNARIRTPLDTSQTSKLLGQISRRPTQKVG